MLAISGQVISGEVYAWVAVFILPINSALNPFLYTFANLRKKVRYIPTKIQGLLKESVFKIFVQVGRLNTLRVFNE